MSIGLAASIKSLRLQVVTTALDSGATPAELLVYSGSQPATGASPSGALLATMAWTGSSFDTVTAGVLYFEIPPSALVTSSGVAGFVRLRNGDGVFVADLDVGDMASSAACKFDDLNLYAGGIVTAVSIAITE